MKTTKIKGRFVIGHDGSSHVFYRDGEVVYKGDTITASWNQNNCKKRKGY